MKYLKKKLNLKIQAINKDFQLHFQQKIFFLKFISFKSN